ncbi:hypothetical protein KKG41_06415 [Patescibacteria group bacterium]|nr:hypothetical protein [Patescibacteria group bacterium]
MNEIIKIIKTISLILLIVTGVLLIFYNYNRNVNWLLIILQGSLALVATFIGVYVAEAFTRKRINDDNEQRNKRIFCSAIKYLFTEIIHNYSNLKYAYDRIEEQEPPDKCDALRFINSWLKFKQHVYSSFIASGAVHSFENNDLINAIQQIYARIWKIELDLNMAENVFKPKPPKNIKTGEMTTKLFIMVKETLKHSLNIYEVNIKIILKHMNTNGISFYITKKDGECIDIMKGDNYKRVADASTPLK